MTFGKVMGGGFPAAAFGGRADLMQNLAPVGRSTRLGRSRETPSPPRLVWRRCVWRLRSTSRSTTRRHCCGASARAGPDAAGVSHVIQNAGNLFSVFFVPDGVTAVPDYATATQQSTAAYAAFFHSMLRSGVYLPPSVYEAWFLSAAHDDRALNRIVDATGRGSRRCERLDSGRGGRMGQNRTIVHLVRHGEVDNPAGLLYGRPRLHLSELGIQMAQRVADHFRDRDVVHPGARPWNGRRRRLH